MPFPPRSFVAVVASLVCFVVSAQAPCLQFRSAGGSGNDVLKAMAVDAEGSTYLTGTFTNSMVLGDGTLTGAAYSHFVAKTDATEHLVWSHVFSTDMWSGPQAIALTGDGGLVITGDFQGPLDFGDCTLLHPGSTDLFVVKLNTVDGTCMWLQQGQAIGYTHSRHLAVGPDGRVHVGGGFWGYCTFGTTVLHCTGTMSPFVGVYAADGTALWARQVVDALGGTMNSVAADPLGGTWAVGSFGSTGIFGNGITLSNPEGNAFIAKYDDAGTPLWARQRWDGATGEFLQVGCDEDGDAYVLRSQPPGVVKYTASGDTAWTMSWDGLGFGTSICPFGVRGSRAWVPARYTDTLAIGEDVLVSSNTTYKFALVEIGADGEVASLTGYDTNGAYNMYPMAFTFGADEAPMVGGYYNCTTMTPDPSMQLDCLGSMDIFHSRACAITSVAEMDDAPVRAFPMPFSDGVHIILPDDAGCCALQLTDAYGRDVWRGRTCKHDLVLTPPGSAKALYMLRVTRSDGMLMALPIIRE